jgi:hypothetical protein
MFNNPLPGVPNIESPFFEQIFSAAGLDAKTLAVAKALHTDGYAVIDFPDPDFDAVAERIKADLRSSYDWEQWLKTGFDVGVGLRLQDACWTNADVMRLATNQAVMELLSMLYGRRAFPVHTLNFPVGTQQHFHTDSVHFSSMPQRFMCGVWVAMEDIDEDAGPLVYYPGSHKWPIFTNEHIGVCAAERATPPDQSLYEPLWEALVEANATPRVRFTAKKGQALIWTANLLHGGDRQSDKTKTRWSQVTHYFFENCAYYTPMSSDPFYGHIDFRDAYDISNRSQVKQMYAGHEIDSAFVQAMRADKRDEKALQEPPPRPGFRSTVARLVSGYRRRAD